MFDDGKVVLRPINFDDDVHTLAVIGPSGGGKSTLLRIIGGLILPSSERFLWTEKKFLLTKESCKAFVKSLGMYFSRADFSAIWMHKCCAVPLIKVHGYTKSDTGDRAMELLARFGLKDDYKKACCPFRRTAAACSNSTCHCRQAENPFAGWAYQCPWPWIYHRVWILLMSLSRREWILLLWPTKMGLPSTPVIRWPFCVREH